MASRLVRTPISTALHMFIIVAAAATAAAGQSYDATRRLQELTRWHVSVVNGLSGGKALFLHCRSKDDDLGMKNLTAGSNATWSFRENVFGRTLFWCYAREEGRRREATFKVFWHDVLLFYTCGWSRCIWVAKDDGVYIRDLDQGGHVDQLRYTWEIPSSNV